MVRALTDRTWRGRARAAVPLLAFILLVVTPFLTFLRFNGYPFLTPETIVATLLFGSIGAGLFMVHGRGGAWRVAALSVALLLFLDLQFDLQRAVSFKVLPILVVALAWILRTHLASVLAVAGATFTLTALVLPIRRNTVVRWTPSQPVVVRESLPPVFYIVLDELAGTDHLRDVAGGSTPAAIEMEALLERHGLAFFPTAVSRYANTEVALSALLNDSVVRRADALVRGRVRGTMDAPEYWPPFVVQASTEFRDLAARGYVLDAYQTDYLDFCRTGDIPVERCTTYPGNSAARIAAMDLAASRRGVVLLLHYLHRSSYAFARALTAYRSAVAARPQSGGPRLASLDCCQIIGASFRDAVEFVKRDAAQGMRGRLFLIHAMDPHFPYVRDAECQVVEDRRLWLEARDPQAAPRHNTPEGRRLRYERYGAQLQCLARQLGAFLTWLSESAGARDAVIVLHGDHGSRVGEHAPSAGREGDLTGADIADYFVTLFAVRSPGVRPGRVDRTTALEHLLAAFLPSGIANAEPREIDTITVFLQTPGPELAPLLVRRTVAGGPGARWVSGTATVR